MSESRAQRCDYMDKGFWLETAGAYTEQPPLDGSQRADVAIVGGGFTGLSTALHLKQAQPELNVALLEAEVIGWGASGRNAGFAMTLFGLTLGLTKTFFGRPNALQAQRYMQRAVDYVGELVAEHRLDCDYERTGFLRVATNAAYERRIRREIDLAHAVGIDDIGWLPAAQLAELVRSPRYLGAWHEQRCALVNPAKLSRELRRICLDKGVTIHERTRVSELSRRGQGAVVLETDRGSVSAERVVLATNAWSHLIPEIRGKQTPAWTYIVLTEPLTPRQLEPIGWRQRQGIEDARNLVHYYRLTADNRLLMGGGDVEIGYGRRMDRDAHHRIWRHLEGHIRETFPSLADVAITHRWGGPVSVPLEMIPAIGTLGDRRVIWSLGCMGHGVSLAHLNGLTIAQLLRGERSWLTETFFVNRRTLPWPPDPLRYAAGYAVRGYMRVEDALRER